MMGNSEEQNAQGRAQSAECPVPGAKFKMQNSECRMQSEKCKE